MKKIIKEDSLLASRKIIIVYLLFFLQTLVFVNYNTNVYASEHFNDEMKKISNVTVGDKFTDDTILVTLKNTTSLKREYSIYDFTNLDLIDVIDISNLTSEKDEEHNLNKIEDDCEVTLALKLANPSKETVIEYIHLLEERNDVYFAEPNYIGEFSSMMPNDPLKSSQWALNNINLPNAWDFSTGENSVKVGIVDSGIDKTHPDLVNRVNQELSKDFSGGDNPWADGNYHGTHVAGIVGAQGNNSIGCVGVNWNIELVSLKVGNEGPTSQAVAQAITYANANDIKILNLSLSVTETEVMTNAINLYDGIIICSSGNKGTNNVGYPARLDNSKIISVGSIDSNNTISNFSSWGKVDVWAPGENILSTIPTNYCLEHNIVFNDGSRLCEFSSYRIEMLNNYVDNGTFTWNQIINDFEKLFKHSPSFFVVFPHEEMGYHYLDGTSMSAPYVSGVAALLLSYNTNLSIQQIRNSIISGADNISVTMPNNTNQNIRKLDAHGAVNYAYLKYIHQHSYTMQYYNYQWHKPTCECGLINEKITEGHSVLQSEIVSGRYARCLGCNYLLDLNRDIAFIGMSSSLVTQVSINGSYILPSGIIVLVDEDLDAYLNGTLIFYEKDKVTVIQ